MKLACSFTTTQFGRARAHWIRSAQYVEGKLVGTAVSADGLTANTEGFEPFLGGTFTIMDWPTGRIEHQLDLDAPAGFVLDGTTLHVNNMRLHRLEIFDLERRRMIGEIRNRHFNNLHSLERTARGFLVSSSGIDAVLEIDDEGRTLFDWWATEHGIDRLGDGTTRTIDRSLNHSVRFYPTLFQVTHVNSARRDRDGSILATLFHQGALVRIGRDGTVTTLVDGLSCPHGVHRFGDGWVVPNTRRNQVVLLDTAFRPYKTIELGFAWVQDAVPLRDGTLLVADANHHRIVQVDVGEGDAAPRIVTEVAVSKEWRVYQVMPLGDA